MLILQRKVGVGAGWEQVSGASYDGISFSFSGQTTAPEQLQFSPDGTKMYLSESLTSSVYQYTLPTPWSLVGASYSGISFSVLSEDFAPQGLAFKADGTKMYILGGGSESIYQYTLPTPWSLVGASYDSASHNITPQGSAPRELQFKPDGTKMYDAEIATGAYIKQFSLLTPWVITSTSYDSSDLSVNAQEPGTLGLHFRPDGTSVFIIGNNNDSVHQYDMSVPWSVSSGVFNSSFSVNAQDTSPSSIVFNPSGTKFYIVGYTNATIFQYSF